MGRNILFITVLFMAKYRLLLLLNKYEASLLCVGRKALC